MGFCSYYFSEVISEGDAVDPCSVKHVILIMGKV